MQRNNDWRSSGDTGRAPRQEPKSGKSLPAAVLDRVLFEFRKRPKPWYFVLAGDILLIGVSLVVFALFHHVLPRNEKSEGIVIEPPADFVQTAATEEPGVTAEPTAEPEPTDEPEPTLPVDFGLSGVGYETEVPEPTELPEELTITASRTGDFSDRFSDKFTSGDVENSHEDGVYVYRSANLNIRAE